MSSPRHGTRQSGTAIGSTPGTPWSPTALSPSSPALYALRAAPASCGSDLGSGSSLVRERYHEDASPGPGKAYVQARGRTPAGLSDLRLGPEGFENALDHWSARHAGRT